VGFGAAGGSTEKGKKPQMARTKKTQSAKLKAQMKAAERQNGKARGRSGHVHDGTATVRERTRGMEEGPVWREGRCGCLVVSAS
jgi:hypothetical protein